MTTKKPTAKKATAKKTTKKTTAKKAAPRPKADPVLTELRKITKLLTELRDLKTAEGLLS